MSTSAVSSNGLISGLDTASIISAMQSVAQQPILAIQKKEAGYQVQISAYGTISNDLNKLQTAVDTLSQVSNVNNYNVSSSNTSVLTATANSNATPGTHSVTVNTLATNQRLISGSFSPAAAVGAGDIYLTVGSNAPVDIQVGSSDTISTIAKTINAAGAGVTATVINDGTNDYLTLSGDSTGSANAFSLSVTKYGTSASDASNTDGTGLANLVYSSGGSGNGLISTQSAGNASLNVDGINNIVRSSNTITDVIPGMTLTLLSVSPTATGATTATPTTLTATRDDSVLKTNIGAFVTAYNSYVTDMNSLQSYDPSTGNTGTLFGDYTVQQVQSQVQQYMDTNINGNTLASMGITLDTTGSVQSALDPLQFDSSKLDTQFASNVSGVSSFFTSSSGFASQLFNGLTSVLDPVSGLLTTASSGLQSTITGLNTDVTDMRARLTDQQTTLQNEFNNMETLLSGYKNTASMLTQQFP